MSNDYFTVPTDIALYTPARPGPLNQAMDSLEAAFDMLPAPGTFNVLLREPVVAGGTANALTITNAAPIEAYEFGQRITFQASATNTGPVTVNVDGVGAKELRLGDGNALDANNLVEDRIYDAVYDGTYFQMLAGGSAASYSSAALAAAAEAEASADAAAASEAAAAASAAEAATFEPSNFYLKTETYSEAEIDAAIAAAVAALIDGAPGALNTLNELAAAINDDASYAASVTTALALKAPLASPAFTGNPTAPTQSAGDNSTKLATTAYVDGKANLVLIDTLDVSGGGTAWSKTGLPQTYSALFMVVDGVSHSGAGTTQLRIEMSGDGGGTWSSPINLNSTGIAAASTQDGFTLLTGYSTDTTLVSARADVLADYGSLQVFPDSLVRIDGGVDAIRFSYAAGYTGDGGVIRIYGVA